jgi:hypothetical protein
VAPPARPLHAESAISRFPSQVWAVLAGLASYGEWNPFFRSVSGQLREGAKLTLRMVPSQGKEMPWA